MIDSLSRTKKRSILLLLDWLAVLVALFSAYALRYGTALPVEAVSLSWPVIMAVVLVAPVVLLFMRLPSIKLSTFDMRGAMRIAIAALLLGIAASVFSVTFGLGSPRSIPGIFAATFFMLSFMGRVLAVQFLLEPHNGSKATPIAIYGAGAAGIQLSSALRQSAEVRPVCFVDDDPNYRGLIISGLRVRSRVGLESMVTEGLIKKVLIAMPSLSQSELDKVVGELRPLGIEIQVLPSYVDLISGKSMELRTVSPDALLGRDKVDLDVPAIAKTYAGRTIMVTGAGGSIGSELCKQLLVCRPAKIVLFEQSELALYNIEGILRPLVNDQDVEIVARLGSVCDMVRVETVLSEEQVEIVLHAAAYKHVPLVEENEVEGARNNVLGTKTVAEAAQKFGVERFILVSTDKAVRPTNVMGATKRLAELVLQDLSTRSETTRFSMVRFGNVLGSSGSVLPLFQRQIRLGGPVTVTHPKVTRFFMTIPEAARLVLLAGAFSEGGDVFVLDMGKPMMIIDIARKMIEMSGARIKSPETPDGIEIKVTGLRPGEKLYEELLIDDDSLLTTPHNKILRANEERLSEIQILRMTKDLRSAVIKSDPAAIRAVIERDVSGYHQPNDTEANQQALK